MAMINYGPEYGKLVVISDVVDQNKVRMAAGSGHGLGMQEQHSAGGAVLRSHQGPKTLSMTNHNVGCGPWSEEGRLGGQLGSSSGSGNLGGP